MVGFSIVLYSRGVLKKAQFLVVAIVAALMVLTAFPVCLDYGKTQNDWSTVSSFPQSVASSPLPNLSESVAPSSPSASGDQTDNNTTTATNVTSGGAVKASFTVVPQPASNREESRAAQIQETPISQPLTRTDVRPESGGRRQTWLLLASILLTGIAATGIAVLLRFRTRN
jgi:hypothetical protein